MSPAWASVHTPEVDIVKRAPSHGHVVDLQRATVKTVKAHLSNLFSKIGVLDRTQAAVWAERHTPERPGFDAF